MSEDKEVMLCPECLKPLEYHKSTFVQYQPSVYFCNQHGEVDVRFVKGFNKGYSRSTKFVHLDEEIVDKIMCENAWKLERQQDLVILTFERNDLIKTICSTFGTKPEREVLSTREICDIINNWDNCSRMELAQEIHDKLKQRK